MATKNELKDIAIELAISLGIEIDTDRMNHDKLTELVKDLKAKQTDAETVTQADETDTPVAEEVVEDVELDTPVAEVGKAYTVAAGKCITSKRGMIDSGEVVEVKDLPGGEDSLIVLVKKGIVVWG